MKNGMKLAFGLLVSVAVCGSELEAFGWFGGVKTAEKLEENFGMELEETLNETIQATLDEFLGSMVMAESSTEEKLVLTRLLERINDLTKRTGLAQDTVMNYISSRLPEMIAGNELKVASFIERNNDLLLNQAHNLAEKIGIDSVNRSDFAENFIATLKKIATLPEEAEESSQNWILDIISNNPKMSAAAIASLVAVPAITIAGIAYLSEPSAPVVKPKAPSFGYGK